MAKYTNEYIKAETRRLYESLPQDPEERKKRLDVRDKVIELNYAWFGYIASHKFINNPTVSYEDKFQSAVLHFCECWWWYLYEAKYRTDLSFSVFFKPRITEMMERELNQVKYSLDRSLRMEAGEQLGKHWAKVTYDDLKYVKLPVEKMNSLKAIFGSLYFADLSEHELYIEAPVEYDSPFDKLDEDFDSVEELLIHDMIYLEAKLTDKELRKMSDMYGIRLDVLKAKLPIAEKMLYQRIQDSLNTYETL